MDNKGKDRGALVLTRTPGQSIYLIFNEGKKDEAFVEVELGKIQGRQARILTRAPASVKILRDELYEQ